MQLSDPRSRTVLERVRRIPEGSVTADGSLAKGERQRALLDAEGVPFRGARVDMREAWVPAES